MDLGILTIPVLVMLGYFGFSFATSHHEVIIDQIDVPASVAERGYSSSVVTERVAEAYRNINKGARTAKQLRDFGLQSDSTVVGALGDYFNVGSVVKALRDDLGLIEFKIGGDIIDEAQTWDLRIRVERSGGATEAVTVSGPSGSPKALFFEAAAAAMRLTDPYVLACYYYEVQMNAGTTDFAATRRELERAIGVLPLDTYDWLYNLWGLTLLAEAKPKAAIAEFRRVLDLNPGFVLAIHNWGRALASQGRYREAIGKYRQVVEIELGQLHNARSYAEWGAALAALGEPKEAEALIQRALAIDPRSDRAYYLWGQVLEIAKRYEEARAKYRLALLFYPRRVSYQVDIDRVTDLLGSRDS
jgi:cytochrome c-type biogenesis protein CcmH/NrfG